MFPTIYIGNHSYGQVLLENPEFHYLTGADKSDPLNQTRVVSWKVFYGSIILNQGDNANTTNAQSGIASFKLTNPFQLQPISGATGSVGGTGAGPQCILEDPSNQFIYTANFYDSSITGLSINQNAGDLGCHLPEILKTFASLQNVCGRQIIHRRTGHFSVPRRAAKALTSSISSSPSTASSIAAVAATPSTHAQAFRNRAR